ncbi:hypothetical protein CMT19_15655 [Elizabethkingia anophelis]|nr:hypothetical protein [Elizabethkingia anophelis]
MLNNKLIILLQIIQNNGNIKRLTREGVSFKSIAQLTTIAIEKEYLEYKEEKILLTKQGVSYLEENLKQIKKNNKAEWIEKDLKSKINRIDKNTIFVPRQDELTF